MVLASLGGQIFVTLVLILAWSQQWDPDTDVSGELCAVCALSQVPELPKISSGHFDCEWPLPGSCEHLSLHTPK